MLLLNCSIKDLCNFVESCFFFVSSRVKYMYPKLVPEVLNFFSIILAVFRVSCFF